MAPELPFKILRFKPQTGEQKKKSAIIVLQEWWGINEQIKKHAQRIADNVKIMTVVPDLYKGKLGLSSEEASHLMNNLDWKKASIELENLNDFLKKENSYEKIGSIGFCMGGAMSLTLASHLVSKNDPLNAVITCYGIPSNSLVDISNIAIKTPVQGHFGKEDKLTGFSDPNAANSFERRLREGVERFDVMNYDIQIYRYDNEGHAFLNDEEWSLNKRKELGYAGGENQEVKDLAWKRIYEFFNKYL
ncbi:6714_t:CDS:2 [Diversispora eburnea]|uniref:6714_t:CDS:1 n=1 Tax=Diversispora eburnea TaxID=1213867 RepID=A0A9N8VBB8_9GLOM|nr:6714_t:CDS:2 [Diversispora eburnea]